mmetsp:Transcript_98675/g.226724  ORF Transcript_98675/g.226724 Transcript_98675/m.226724 type:complete len:255 (+) Transcript_98675:1135-1899(+)
MPSPVYVPSDPGVQHSLQGSLPPQHHVPQVRGILSRGSAQHPMHSMKLILRQNPPSTRRENSGRWYNGGISDCPGAHWLRNEILARGTASQRCPGSFVGFQSWWHYSGWLRCCRCRRCCWGRCRLCCCQCRWGCWLRCGHTGHQQLIAGLRGHFPHQLDERRLTRRPLPGRLAGRLRPKVQPANGLCHLRVTVGTRPLARCSRHAQTNLGNVPAGRWRLHPRPNCQGHFWGPPHRALLRTRGPGGRVSTRHSER